MRIKSLINHPVSQQVNELFWKINGDNIQWTNEEGPVDVLLFDTRINDWQKIRDYPAAITVCLDLAHAGTDKVAGWKNYEHQGRHYTIVECRDNTINNPAIISIDFMFNRSKAYYTDSQRRTDKSWYIKSIDDFSLWPIESPEKKTKIFLSPHKLLRPNLLYRVKFSNLVQTYYQDLGYISNTREQHTDHIEKNLDPTLPSTIELLRELRHRPFGQILFSHSFDTTATKVSDLCNLGRSKQYSAPNGYCPIHNAYYRESYFSAYVETIEYGSTVLITEKTLDPLIKGHFILPFGSAGTVSDIQRLGFKLPDFIDYSYDSITHDSTRYARYCKEFHRLATTDRKIWDQWWVDNLDILHYNRNVFYNQDYDCVNFEKLLQAVR